jgi:hypothetical protein
MRLEIGRETRNTHAVTLALGLRLSNEFLDRFSGACLELVKSGAQQPKVAGVFKLLT